MRPHVQSLQALLLFTGLPSGSGRVQIGLSLSWAVRSDFPPSGRSGESRAQSALRFALSVAVPVRLFRLSGLAALVDPDAEPGPGKEAETGTGTGADEDEDEDEDEEEGEVYAMTESEGVGRSGM